ncbi:hypothetical protein [uncultured Aeromicrobium sp.]|uniref:hypothetical protein n=1 Tax=uncultured Aeromicrobium sp. TaxID=337820 RepID=UPI0025FA4048|nr:hypothetical protein [uncultured Aeromicrobium sp.]
MALLTGLFAARNSAGTGTSPRGARRALGGLLARDGAGPVVRTGVLFDNGSPVVAGTGSWTVSVRPFTAVAKYTDANGPVVFANDAPASITIPPAPGSGSRIDIVYALHPLISADGGSGTSVTPGLGVASSTASGSPTPPTIPAGAVEISRATITAGMTSSADAAWSLPQWTVANGGVIPLGSGRFLAWDGTDWYELASARREGPWTPTQLYNGWQRNTGTHALRIWREGEFIIWEGGIYGGGTNTRAFTLPEWARPRTKPVIRVRNSGPSPDGVLDIYANGDVHPRGSDPGVIDVSQLMWWVGRVY